MTIPLTTPLPSQPLAPTVRYIPQGGALSALQCRDRNVLLDGPANTGKSYAGLWKMHLAAIKYPGMHGLLLRKTQVSLKASTLVTYRERILGAQTPVKFWTAKGDEAAHYAYPNGSKLYIGGMDNSAKIMSTEYDLAFWDEATDGEESEWEALLTRLRYGKMPYQQLLGACNPQGPTHWLNQRALSGRVTRILSRHEDNPAVTLEYLAMLEGLTGVRKLRLYYGAWAAADGMVYEDAWDAARNIVERASISKRPGDLYGDCGIDPTWPRYMSIDFGFTHPFTAQWWAEDPDGRLWMYREIYMTHKLVEDHAADIIKYSRWGKADGDPLPRAIICDHDAEGRATLERHLAVLGRGLRTTAADKRVLEGIQAVASRMRAAGDGRPRLLLLRDALVQRDPVLLDAKHPACAAEEVESYVWELRGNGKRGEAPVKEFDHALDAARYLVMSRDMRARTARLGGTLS